MPMEKSFTPNSDPEHFNELLGKRNLRTASPHLVSNIMAYVRCTRNEKTSMLGDLKLFLN
ncbi:MAG TPA: hypothetical protein VJ937_08205 [Salinivirga sp.]|nr:hypothetical protein [Salinivirga sp.]